MPIPGINELRPIARTVAQMLADWTGVPIMRSGKSMAEELDANGLLAPEQDRRPMSSAKPQYWPPPADAAAAVALLQRESVWHIGGYDGCLCTRLSVMHFDIEVACRKSSSGAKNGATLVTISCRTLDCTADDLTIVGDEVKRQVLAAEPGATVMIEFAQE
jgi:hypothetical protein